MVGAGRPARGRAPPGRRDDGRSRQQGPAQPGAAGPNNVRRDVDRGRRGSPGPRTGASSAAERRPEWTAGPGSARSGGPATTCGETSTVVGAGRPARGQAPPGRRDDGRSRPRGPAQLGAADSQQRAARRRQRSARVARPEDRHLQGGGTTAGVDSGVQLSPERRARRSEDKGREQTKKRFKDWTKDGITHKELTATQCQRHKNARSQSPNELYEFGAAMNNPKQLRAQKFVRRNLFVQSQGRTE